MSKTLQIKHPQLPEKEETSLAVKYTTGTALTVINNDGWADNDILVAGMPGREKTEMGKVSGVTGDQQIDLDAALKFSHGIDTPLLRSSYDQISLERQPSGCAFAEIVEGKKNIQWDEKDGHTKIEVAAGLDADNYRWRFYNSLTTTYSPYSGTLPGTGLTQFHAGYLIKMVRFFGKMPAFKGITDNDILKSLNRGCRRIDTLHDRWFFALTQDTDDTRVQSVASTYKYGLPSNFRGMDTLSILDENSQKYNLLYRPLIVFDALKVDDLNTANDNNNSKEWTLFPPDTSNTVGYFGVHPTPKDTSVYFYRRYWKFLDELTNFASLTPIPLPEILINYALFELYKLREDRDNAKSYWQQFQEDIVMLKRLQRRQIGQAQITHYRGQTGFAKLFGTLGLQNLDVIRENYW